MNSKKTLSIALIFALLCIAFCGCTTNNSDTKITLERTTKGITQEYSKHIDKNNTSTTEKQKNVTSKEETSNKKPKNKVEIFTQSGSKKIKNAVSSTTTNDETSNTTKANSTAIEQTITTATNTTTTTTKTSTTATTVATTTTKKQKSSCTVKISCNEILSNFSKLAKGHEKYVPSNGVILSNFECSYKENLTAYDALKTACNDNNIKLTTSNTAFGVYVIGINNLDEKDCGKYSGWKYRVNGVEPNKACDKYVLQKGDTLEFFYVCTY